MACKLDVGIYNLSVPTAGLLVRAKISSAARQIIQTLIQVCYLAKFTDAKQSGNELGLRKGCVMTPLDYFKLQAKNLHRDCKTQTTNVDEADGRTYFAYSPKFFDIERIFLEYAWDEEDFSLMKAQHLFALMLGFGKWADLLKASDEELELAKLLWDNQHKIGVVDWRSYIAGAEEDNDTAFDTADRIAIFNRVFVEVDDHRNQFRDYRLGRNPKLVPTEFRNLR